MRDALPDRRRHPRLIVVGIGNPHRGDDGVGRLVAGLVRGQPGPGTEVIDCAEPTGLLTAWNGVDAAWIIDAAGPPAPLAGPDRAGTVRRLAVVEGGPLHPDSVASTHGLDIAHVIEIGRALGELPTLVVIYTIRAHHLSATTPIHPQVASAAHRVAKAVVAEAAAYPTVLGGLPSDDQVWSRWDGELPADDQHHVRHH
ncbi:MULTISPECIES: hydrogenase maturation protease [Pseudofrankia]|uniref:hydrogenase maturation protease n=1 Tax=Pseudofrankia TaxID=2994363 RepID=UPI000234D7B8|nr:MULTISPECIES: hydrogenase maturation protease [Pseudofrankia]OHV32296.1 hypothetical protein BCD49_30500 [Pseudofrankia sp. EUN1h]